MFAVCRRGSRPSICYFLVLPLEIRNIIYEFFIKDALDYYSPPIHGLRYWQTGRYHEHKFDLAITTSKVVFRNVRYPGHLLIVNRQVYEEMSTLIYSRIQHIKLTGDFLLGLAPTKPMFEILQRRPWIRHRTKTVSVDLILCGSHSACRGPGIDSHFIAIHPALRAKIREVDSRYFPLWLRDIGGRKHFRFLSVWHILLSLGVSVGNAVPKKRSDGQTLSKLAELLEGFPYLETVELETEHHHLLSLFPEHHHLLSLFPEPLETASSFLSLSSKGVVINMLLRDWQVKQWASVLKRNGLDESRFWHENDPNGQNATFSKKTYGIVFYNIMNCIDTGSFVQRPEGLHGDLSLDD
jgi:hypothetical protein